jgi:putative FmdB family regulatory protein
MPIYAYRCMDCGEQFEQYAAYIDKKDKFCPICGSDYCQKLYLTPAIIYKGEGFYTTDNKKDKKEV